MEELFVPYQIAIELRKQGFDEPCLAGYFCYTSLSEKTKIELHTFSGPVMGKNVVFKNSDSYYKMDGNTNVTAPLYQQVIDWLVKIHKIKIRLIPYTSGKDKWGIWKWIDTGNGWAEYFPKTEDGKYIFLETCDLCIQEALKLI